MSVWSAITDSNKVFNYAQVFGVKDVTTAEMLAAIKDWYALYYDTAKNATEDPALRLPVAIVSKLYKAIFSEYTASASLKGTKGDFVNRLVKGLDEQRKKAIQQMLIGGYCLLKPVPTATGFDFIVIRRPDMLVFGRDADGRVTDLGTSECTQVGATTYTLLERRTMDTTGYLTIESRLFASQAEGVLGREVPLNTLDKYAELVPVLRLPQPVFSIGLIPLVCPAENCVDGSEDAVSVYAAAAEAIHTVNRNEAQLNKEFEHGRMRMAVSDTMLRQGGDGRKMLVDDIFVGAPIPDMDGNMGITVFAPALRERSYIARKKEALRDIESLIGFKRGVLSDVETADKTATEITSSAGEYNLTIQDFQEEWERCVRETVRVCGILGQIYHVPGTVATDPQKDISVNWGNGILYDEDKEWATLMQLVNAGMLKPEIALAWKFDLPWDKPEDIALIRDKYMPVDEETEDEPEC